MQPAALHPLFDRLTLGFVVLLIAVPVTMLEVVRPSPGALRMATETLVSRTLHTPAPAPASKPAAPAAKPQPVPAKPAPASASTVKTATTTSFVHLRAAKSVSSAITTDLPAGTVVQLRDDADATWQGVTYQGKSGYIYRAYLQYQPATTTP